MNKENYQYPQKWLNIGDVNPERHGGIFVKWDNNEWHIIQTRHFAEIPNEVSENEHMFEHMYMELQDIFKDSNPEKGLTAWALRELKTFSGLSFSVIENESELPENETYADYMRFLLKDCKHDLITNLVFAFTAKGTYSIDYDADYWGYLENHGIEKEEFKG